MDERTTRRLHRLLAFGRLSRPETDAIRESVLDAVERKEKRPAQVIRYAGWAGAVLAAAAAVLLVVKLPAKPDGRVHDEEGVSGPVLEVSCSPGTLAACPATSDLVFTLSGKGARGILSAYAEPLEHDAKPTFYFSRVDRSAELNLPAQGTRGLRRVERVPGSLRPGRYRVHAFLANRPLERDEMQHPSGVDTLATARVDVVIVE